MKKSKQTPKSQVRSALRMLWLHSRERAEALKRDKYSCQECGVKKSTGVKIHVHHLNGINWEKIETYIFKHLLVPSKDLITLCKSCHDKETYHETN